MKYVSCDIKEKVAYIIPIGDLHIGDKAFSQNVKKIKGYIDWVKETPNARVVLGGDIFNVATRESATPPFDNRSDEFEYGIELFSPIKDKIVAAVIGNHEARLQDYANIDLMAHFCFRLKIPYMGYSGVVAFRVGKYKDRFRQYYPIYFHHGTGGGSTPGSKLNRAVKLNEIVEGCDVYCIFHSHGLSASPRESFYPNPKTKTMNQRRKWYIVCGSYLDWVDSYAEQKMLVPEKLGSPRIRLSGIKDKHSVHVSL